MITVFPQNVSNDPVELRRPIPTATLKSVIERLAEYDKIPVVVKEDTFGISDGALFSGLFCESKPCLTVTHKTFKDSYRIMVIEQKSIYNRHYLYVHAGGKSQNQRDASVTKVMDNPGFFARILSSGAQGRLQEENLYYDVVYQLLSDAVATAEELSDDTSQRQAEEERRRAEQARQAEQARKAEQARQAEQARKAEQARQAEQARKAEQARQAEQARKAEQARQAEQARKAEQTRQAEQARKQTEQTRQAEQARRVAQAQQAEQARKLAEMEHYAEQARRKTEQLRQAELEQEAAALERQREQFRREQQVQQQADQAYRAERERKRAEYARTAEEAQQYLASRSQQKTASGAPQVRASLSDTPPLRKLDVDIGLETMGGVFTRILERGTYIPTNKSFTFSTAVDNQTAISLNILQGTGSLASQNQSLGKYEMKGILPAPRGVPRIEITVSVDVNANLKVTAKDLATGKMLTVNIQ